MREDAVIGLVGPSGTLQGKMTLRLPVVDGVTIEVPAVLDMRAAVNPLAGGAQCLEASGSAEAPLALRLPLPDGLGQVDLDLALHGNASLQVQIPGGQGLVQADGQATGPIKLRVTLPENSGSLTVDGTLTTPWTLVTVLPDGRSRLRLQGSIGGRLALNAAPPEGGRVEFGTDLACAVEGVGFLPSGRIELKATTPLRTTLHLKDLPIPQSERALTLDVEVDGSAEVTVEVPDRTAQVRLQAMARVPLAPIVALIRAETEQHVRVETMSLRPPRLLGPHELDLVLYIEARKGIRAKVEVTAQLRIDPRTHQFELKSVQAKGYNPTGSVVGRFFLNPRLFRPLRHTRLLDPATMLPHAMHVDDLRFQSVDLDGLVLAVDLGYDQQV